MADLRIESEALRRRDRSRAAQAAATARLQGLWQHIAAAGASAIVVPERTVSRLELNLEAPVGQDPPLVIATATGTERLVTYSGSPATVSFRGNVTPFTRTLELQHANGRYVIVGSRGGTPEPIASGSATQLVSSGVGGARLQDVAEQVGVDFRQQAFRSAATADVVSMMGGGVCWLDADGNGWLDLFAVNSYSYLDGGHWARHGGLPRSALFRNRGGRFTDVSRSSGADLQLRGNGCVAADFNGDGATDLYVTAAEYDALLWNDGHGQFSEGARAAGITAYGWHSGGAVSDVDGDGRLDVFVAGYADVNAQIPGSESGFPNNYAGVRDLLYLNTGNDRRGRATFREVGAELRLDTRPDLLVTNSHKQLHAVYRSVPPTAGGPLFVDARADIAPAFETELAGWGVSWVDLDNDANLDLVLANGAIPVTSLGKSAQPLQAFENLTAHDRPGQFAAATSAVELSAAPSVNGRGLAAADFDNDGRVDLAVSSVGGKLMLLRNAGAKGNWLTVHLRRFVPGALVTAVLPDGRRLVRELHAGSSYLSSEDPRAQFGLGDADIVRELIVRYPDGRETRLQDVRANQVLAVGR